MPHLGTFVRSVTSVFCDHEWARRRDTGRVYLECVRCLTTTPGVQYGRERVEASSGRASLEIAEAR